MQIVFDFLSGKMPFDEFYKAYHEDPSIAAWLDGLTDFSAPCPPAVNRDAFFALVYNHVKKSGGRISDYIKETVFDGKRGYEFAVEQRMWYSQIAVPVLVAYPKAKTTMYYKRNSHYYLDAMGDSIGGREVEDYAERILDKFPPTMKAGERHKAAREALKEAFHIKDRKYPRWPQSAEWPMGKNSPMQYYGQWQDGDLVRIRFRDVDTGEIRIIDQFY